MTDTPVIPTGPTAADFPEYPMPRAAGCPFAPPPHLRRLLISSDIMPPNFPSSVQGPREGLRRLFNFLFMDDPEHARLRRMETAWFSVKRAEARRSAIQTIVDGRIDDMLVGPKPVDLVQEFALAVSILVICELLGVPSADHGFCQRNSEIPIDRNATPEQKLAILRETDDPAVIAGAV